MLKHKIVTYIEVEYHDLEKLIQDFFKIKRYNVVSAEEEKNDTSWTTTIKNESLDEYETKKLDDWIQSSGSKDSYMTRIIMTRLCQLGELEAGNYMVNICW